MVCDLVISGDLRLNRANSTVAEPISSYILIPACCVSADVENTDPRSDYPLPDPHFLFCIPENGSWFLGLCLKEETKRITNVIDDY